MNIRNEIEWHINFIPKELKILNKERINILWFLFDGGSRYVLNKQLPLTVKYIKGLGREFHIYEMMNYNSVGRNSKPNYPPIFFGIKHTQCRKRQMSIFQEYNQEGYITIDLEMGGSYGKRFFCNSKSYYTSFDHSLQILSIQNEYTKIMYSNMCRCVGNKQIHKYSFEYIQKSFQYYNRNNQPVIAFQSFMDSHDDSFSSTPRLDKDIVNLLTNLKKENILNNTIIILSSDHGMHYGSYMKSKFGNIDHKLPLLTFVYYNNYRSFQNHILLNTKVYIILYYLTKINLLLIMTYIKHYNIFCILIMYN